MARRRDRTFTGCWKCRARKIKCDEIKPRCTPCCRLGVECSGYDTKFIWVEDERQAYRSGGRRLLPCESTWEGIDALPSDFVDVLISQCDSDASPTPISTLIGQASSVQSVHNPFSVFSARVSAPIPLDSEPESVWTESAQDTNEEDVTDEVPRSLVLTTGASPQERFLFHHYSNHISALMLPYQHSQNPWKRLFPAAAIALNSVDEKTLYHTALAHSAFNLAHLRKNEPSMFDVGTKHYVLAIQQLLSLLGRKSRPDSATLASVLSLMYVEVYRGSTHDWTHHYHGVWSLLPRFLESGPHKLDELSCATLQSLNIIKIIGDTSRASWLRKEPGIVSRESLHNEKTLQSCGFATSSFGFTIGAHPEILECIAQITEYARDSSRRAVERGVDEFVASILAVLDIHRCRFERRSPEDVSFGSFEDLSPKKELFDALDAEEMPPEAVSQMGAFVYATYIYLYRTVLNAPPDAIQPYVSATFLNVNTFFTTHNGNFSLWPAFVAAAEACTEEGLVAARAWLEVAVSFGIGSRQSAKRVLQEVWRRRGVLALEAGVDVGMVVVDWREVAQDLDGGILLV